MAYLNECHIDFVDVRSFLPVHLDVDEVFIHDFGNLFTLKRLPLHHVAPVAGGVPHYEVFIKQNVGLQEGTFCKFIRTSITIDQC